MRVTLTPFTREHSRSTQNDELKREAGEITDKSVRRMHML